MIRGILINTLIVYMLMANVYSQNSIDRQVRKLEISNDTSSRRFIVDLPLGWDKKSSSNDASVLGVSPLKGEHDSFRGNIAIQTLILNDHFSSEEVATYLINETINKTDNNTVVKKEGYWKSENNINFYLIEYSYSYKGKRLNSALFCTIKNKRAFMINCTDLVVDFDETFKSEFIKAVQSFKLIS